MEKVKEYIPYVIIILVVVLIRTFIATPIYVHGDSMNKTLYDKDLMILKKYEKNKIDRFDIIVIDLDNEKIIKRVIGMPEEDIEYKDNELYIDGKKLEDNYGNGNTKDFKDYCTKDEYFVLGDNRGNSSDSRVVGCISKDRIMGTTNFVLFPFKRIGTVK